MKRLFALFVGQNASTGRPNQQTGRMSFYGDVMRFDSAKTRQYYIDNHRFSINDHIIVPGGWEKMRSYCLGMDMYNFQEYIRGLDIISMSDLET